MKRLRAILVLLALCGAAAAVAAFAHGSAGATEPGYQRVINDWKADGRIDGTYSLKDLRATRAHVSSDELQYSTLGTQLDAATAKAERADRDNGSSTAGWLIPVIIVIVLVLLIVGAVVIRRRRSPDEPVMVTTDDPDSGADT